MSLKIIYLQSYLIFQTTKFKAKTDQYSASIPLKQRYLKLSLFSPGKERKGWRGKILSWWFLKVVCNFARDTGRTKLFALTWGKFARKLPNQITSLEKVFVGWWFSFKHRDSWLMCRHWLIVFAKKICKHFKLDQKDISI